MQFMILALEDDDDFAARDDPGRSGDYWNAWSGYIAALTDSFVIDVPDLDEALTWAALCPSAESASVEVRPLLPASPAM